MGWSRFLGLDRKDTKIVENSGKSSSRFDHLALDQVEFDQLRRLSAVLLIEKSLARCSADHLARSCSGDHLALDRVEFDGHCPLHVSVIATVATIIAIRPRSLRNARWR